MTNICEHTDRAIKNEILITIYAYYCDYDPGMRFYGTGPKNFKRDLPDKYALAKKLFLNKAKEEIRRSLLFLLFFYIY